MPRVVRSALVLARQVQAEKPRTKWTEAGEPDGLDVIRAITFNKAAGEWLEPLLAEMMDPRIESWEATDKGLTVTFVGRTAADHRDPFPLKDAETVRTT